MVEDLHESKTIFSEKVGNNNIEIAVNLDIQQKIEDSFNDGDTHELSNWIWNASDEELFNIIK